MKKIILLGAVLSLTFACSNNEHSNLEVIKSAEMKRVKVQKHKAYLAKQEAELYKWKYAESKDEMTSKSVYQASLLSKDIAELDFPYDGGTSLELNIRDNNGSKNVFVHASNGQITDDYQNKTLVVRFDDDAPIQFSVVESSDGDPEYRFIVDANRFIKRLKKAKKLKIQLKFYNNGLHVFDFDVKDFKFNH